MNKYERLRQDLEEKGTGKMKCFGDSMKPNIKLVNQLKNVKTNRLQKQTQTKVT